MCPGVRAGEKFIWDWLGMLAELVIDRCSQAENRSKGSVYPSKQSRLAELTPRLTAACWLVAG